MREEVVGRVSTGVLGFYFFYFVIFFCYLEFLF